MQVKVNINPMPAVRMTQKTMFYGRAAEYVAYKNDLAQELRLNLIGTVRGSKVEMTDKPNKSLLPLKGPVKLENVIFYREKQTNCDIDNLLKTVMDVLQTAGILYNDDQVREITKIKMIKGCEQGRFEFTLNTIDYGLSLQKESRAQIPVGAAVR